MGNMDYNNRVVDNKVADMAYNKDRMLVCNRILEYNHTVVHDIHTSVYDIAVDYNDTVADYDTDHQIDQNAIVLGLNVLLMAWVFLLFVQKLMLEQVK